ncbi:hypothetical protein [Marinactinospora rubrisoli]|uniref:Uncharacterized protein n=1 Tax=Marinactinospora rubrisoli TaxID=2715399 RepID=A0ABW2KMD2_9ACTN
MRVRNVVVVGLVAAAAVIGGAGSAGAAIESELAQLQTEHPELAAHHPEFGGAAFKNLPSDVRNTSEWW